MQVKTCLRRPNPSPYHIREEDPSGGLQVQGDVGRCDDLSSMGLTG